MQLWDRASEDQKKEFKRTSIGAGSDVVREGIELYRLLDEPTKKEAARTEDFLNTLYSNLVGKENVIQEERQGKLVTNIAEPESGVNQTIREMTAFTGSMIGVGKLGLPLKGFKAVQAATKAAPKATSTAGFIAQGEIAAQLSLNPNEENLVNMFASSLGAVIDDDGYFSAIEDYLLDPIKSTENKSELENRIGLLAEGLLLTGLVGGAVKVGKGAYNQRENVANNIVNVLNKIKSKGRKASQDFLKVIKSTNSAKRTLQPRKEAALKARQEAGDLGDIEGLEDNFLGLSKFSDRPAIKRISNFLARTFTARGGMTKKMFETDFKFKGLQNKWDKTIENNMLNFDSALQTIYKATKDTSEKVLEDINYLLFTDFRVPGIVTSRGTKAPVSQRETFIKKLNQFPEEARQAILDARDLQDNLSRLLLDSPYISAKDKKIVSDQLGIYVRTSYKKFEDPNYIPTDKVTAAARAFIRQDLINKNANKKNPLTEAEINDEVEVRMEDLAGGEGKYAKIVRRQNKYKGVNRNLLDKKLQLPQEIKDYYGEVTNPLESLSISLNKISRFVNDLDFYDELNKNGKDIYFHDKPRAGFNVQIPTTKQAKKDFKSKQAKADAEIIQPFGALSGKYTSPELARYFTEKQKYNQWFDGEGGVFNQLYQAMALVKGFTQKAATVWNVHTHVQNVLGQAMGTLGQGAFPSIKSFTSTAKVVARDLASKTDKEQQKYVEKLAGYNILNKGPIAREINALMKDVRDNGLKSPFAFITEPVRRNKLLKSASDKVKKSIDGITDLYIAEDDFFKILLYEVELKNLKKFNDALPDNYNGFYKFTSEEAIEREAARRVVGGLPNYDIVPENLQLLRANPLISQFFSFLSESTRIGFTTGIQAAREIKIGKDLMQEGFDEAGSIILKRGTKRMAAYTTLGTGGEFVKYGLKYGVPGGGAVVGYQAINRYISGIDEQQEKDIKSFVAPYARNDNLVITINKEGTPLIFNTSRYDFYDYPNKIVSFIPKLIEEGYDIEGNVKQLFFDYSQEMLTPFFGTTMTPSTGIDYIARNGRDSEGRLMRNPFNKTKVYDTAAGLLDPANMQIFVANLTKNFIPGTAKSIQRYVNNYGKDETKFNQEIHKGKEIIKLLTGIGVTVLNKEYMTNVYEMNTNSYSRDLSARRGLLANAASNAESKEDFIENYKDIQARHYETYREFYNHTSAARRLGLNTYPVLKDKLSKPEAKYLMGGNRFTPIKITSGILERLVNNKNLASDYFEIKRALSTEEQKFSSLPILDYSEKDLEKGRLTKSTGGLITGTEDVPFTEENPADRINPVTGEPYAETSKGVLATLKDRQEDRIPKTYGGLLNNLQRRKKFVAGGIRAGLKFLLKNIAEGKEVPAEELLNALPDKVYRGGTSRIVDSPEGTESVFAASDKFHAQTYASPDAFPKVEASDGKSLLIPESEYRLHEIDISSAQKPYILDNPTPSMKLKMRTKLAELNDINFDPTPETDDLSDALGVLLGRAEGSLKVDSGDFARIARAAGKFLREEGFDLIIDTPSLRKGYINSPEAELYVLKNFPVKAIDDFVPPKVKEQVEEATENVAKKVDEQTLAKEEKFQLKQKERTKKPIDDTLPAFKFFNLKNKDVMAWRAKAEAEVKIKEKDTGLPQKRKRIPELANAAEDLSKNKISVDEYRNEVNKLMPIVPFKQVPEMTPLIDVVRSLNAGLIKEGVGVIGADIPKLSTGTEVGLRLDIPSYNNYDTWVVSIHEGLGRSGKSVGYSNTGWITDVIFNTNPETAYNIATYKSKSTFARANGLWKDHTADEAFKKAQQYMDDPEWSQIGMNPYRFSYFYDKADGMPVVNADEVIQIGPLVLGKNVTKAKPTDKRFEVNLKDGRIFNFSTGGNVETPTEPEEFLIYKLLQDDEERLGFFEGTEVDNSLRLDGTKKSQIGHKGRIKNNVSGKTMTELSAGKPDTEEGFYPLLNPYTTDKQIEFIQNFDFEKNNIFETKVGRQMNRNARKHYKESVEKGVSPFVNDK
tara:strand:- start:38 stop:6079 length:6042 start_codon:yes stop_codon:yes gene_type:complete